MTILAKSALSGLLGALVILPAQAVVPRAEIVTPSDIAKVKDLDEIIVSGNSKSLQAARQALVEAEDRFYARYNATNPDRAYDMLCHEEAPTGTLIRKRYCQPRLVEDVLQADAQRMVTGTSGSIVGIEPELLRAKALVEIKRRLKDRVAKDPELLKALLERAKLQVHYEALRKEKLRGRAIVGD
jgi:hypothetical protein